MLNKLTSTMTRVYNSQNRSDVGGNIVIVSNNMDPPQKPGHWTSAISLRKCEMMSVCADSKEASFTDNKCVGITV